MKKTLLCLVCLLLAFGLLCGCAGEEMLADIALDTLEALDSGAAADAGAAGLNAAGAGVASDASDAGTGELPREGEYTSKEDVALYIHLYGELPANFITKKAAQALGWPGGGLDEYAPGKSIGGDWFGNYEGLLPEKKGREYHECDIDTKGAHSRGAKRIIFSNDGLVYYTDDHYESFTLLYGEE